jgi:protein-disulfide isomerase
VSGRRDREERRAEEEDQAGSAERRQRLIRLGSAAAFIVVAVVAVLIVIATSDSGGGDPSNVQDVSEVNELLDGIPQNGMVLGDLTAQTTLFEFGDLQCPVCKQYSEEVLPQVIENQVRDGETKISFNNYTIIGPESTPAGAAAIAAGEQGRGWSFIELFYRNQGAENSGYVTDKFLTAIAKKAGVRNIAKWNSERKGKRAIEQVESTRIEAEEMSITGTPTFGVLDPRLGDHIVSLGTPSSADDLESAMAELLS